MRLGVRDHELRQQVERAGPRHGIAAARRTIAFLDPRAETVGESRSRVLFHRHDIPPPDLQFPIHGPDGHDPEQELFAEKRREDAVRDLRYEVVRWITADIDQPTDLLSRLRRAFERGRRYL